MGSNHLHEHFRNKKNNELLNELLLYLIDNDDSLTYPEKIELLIEFLKNNSEID